MLAMLARNRSYVIIVRILQPSLRILVLGAMKSFSGFKITSLLQIKDGDEFTEVRQ